MKPSVSVIIRTYNSEATVQRAIDSVSNQTLDQKRISTIIVDDGSVDDTLEQVRKNPGLMILESDHQGSINALNLGLNNVTTPYVIILDSDDWFEPTILERMIDAIESNTELDFVYSDYYEVIDGVKTTVSIRDNIFHTIAAAIMFRMETLRNLGFYDEALIFPEYDILIRLLPTAKKKHIPVALYNYFRRKDCISADKSLVERGKKQLFEKYGKEFPIRDY